MEELIISDALADLVYLIHVLHIYAVLGVDLNQSVHDLALQFNSLVHVEIAGDRHAAPQADAHVLVLVDLGLDVLEDTLLLFHFLGQHFQVLCLLKLQHLQKRVAHLHVLGRNVVALVESLGDGAPLLLKHHVQAADPVNRVCLLPHDLQVCFLLQTGEGVARDQTVVVVLFPESALPV